MKLTRRGLFRTVAGAIAAPVVAQAIPAPLPSGLAGGTTYNNLVQPGTEITLESMEAAVAELQALNERLTGITGPMFFYGQADPGFPVALIKMTVEEKFADWRGWYGQGA